MDKSFEWLGTPVLEPKPMDAPFGWAPLELLAVEGLWRYGFSGEADRVSQQFLSPVLDRYLGNGVIVEKYDVVRRITGARRRITFRLPHQRGRVWMDQRGVHDVAG